MSIKDNEHDRDRDPGPDNGPDSKGPDNRPNDGGAVAPTPLTGNALVSLQKLAAEFNKVDTSSVAGRSGLPMLQFKSRENNGTWMYGQQKTVVEDGSLWAANPLTFMRGYVCFGDNNKKLGERLAPVTQPMLNVADLPDLGFPWQEQWAVNSKCITGIDKDLEVVFKMSTDGGLKAITSLFDAVRDRLNSGQHDGKISPIFKLEKDWYPHPKHGKTWYPVTTIVDWMPIEGPAPTPAPAPAPPSPTLPSSSSVSEPQPRRRRVA
jgi:hypothetical protein